MRGSEALAACAALGEELVQQLVTHRGVPVLLQAALSVPTPAVIAHAYRALAATVHIPVGKAAIAALPSILQTLEGVRASWHTQRAISDCITDIIDTLRA